jgi:hypothetical protein
MSTTSSIMPRTRHTAIAAALACAAVIGPAATAHAGVSPISVGTATLVAHGTVVSVPMTVTCSGSDGSAPFAYANITQRRGNRTITGTSLNSPPPAFTCDGTLQSFTVTVIPDNGGAFKTGEAWINASVSIFTETGSVASSVAQVIRIR